jgi:D-inositol-3-phosphate glycosyltransferase
MRIAFVDTIGSRAGMDYYNEMFATALSKNNIKVKIFSTGTGNFSVKKFSDSNSRFVRYVVNAWRFWKLSKEDLSQFDYILLHLFHPSKPFLTGVQNLNRHGSKIILIVHDAESLIYKTDLTFLKKCLNLSSLIFVHNNFTKTEVEKHTEKKIFIIPHGNYISLVSNTDITNSCKLLGLNPANFYILFFGMIKKNKGFSVLMESMKFVNPEVNFIIAGKPRDLSSAEINNMIEESGHKERINYSGEYISNEKRDLLFIACDAVTLPYIKAFQSGVLIMAMSYGKPVIASDIPPFKEMIEDDVSGYLFESSNANSLAEKINYVFENRNLIRETGNRAKAIATLNNSWEKVAWQFNDAISQV